MHASVFREIQFVNIILTGVSDEASRIFIILTEFSSQPYALLGLRDLMILRVVTAVSGTWKGTSREKLFAELGLESLNSRRWSRRLILFYKFTNNLAPKYTTDLIPPLRQSRYSLRKQDAVGRIRTRTDKFQSTFYPQSIRME